MDYGLAFVAGAIHKYYDDIQFKKKILAVLSLFKIGLKVE
jgi:hypothetical protein